MHKYIVAGDKNKNCSSKTHFYLKILGSRSQKKSRNCNCDQRKPKKKLYWCFKIQLCLTPRLWNYRSDGSTLTPLQTCSLINGVWLVMTFTSHLAKYSQYLWDRKFLLWPIKIKKIEKNRWCLGSSGRQPVSAAAVMEWTGRQSSV